MKTESFWQRHAYVMYMCVTGHGHAAASGPAFILTQLSVQFGLGGSGGCRRQVGVTQLPEEERRRSCKLLLERRGEKRTRGIIRILLTNDPSSRSPTDMQTTDFLSVTNISQTGHSTTPRDSVQENINWICSKGQLWWSPTITDFLIYFNVKMKPSCFGQTYLLSLQPVWTWNWDTLPHRMWQMSEMHIL